MDKQVAAIQTSRIPLILESSFTWKGCVYKVKDVQWQEVWNYDNDPHTPQYYHNYNQFALGALGNVSGRTYITSYTRKEYEDFMLFFKRRYNISVGLVFEKVKLELDK